MKKKIFILVLALTLLATGCGNTDNKTVTIGNTGTPGENSTADKENNGKEDAKLYFEYANVKIMPKYFADSIVEAVNEEYAYYESPSCAYVGLDKCYVYSGFTIYTYPDEDAVDHVLQVVLTDDSVSTPEGIRIGDSAEKVIETYGNDYIEADGSYAYVQGTVKLMFIIKDGSVYSIQYGIAE